MPSPICSRSSSASSADNVGYLAKLSCPFCPPSLPNLSPFFTSHFIELTRVTLTMTSLALSASTQSTSNKNGGSVLPKLPIPLFFDMSSSLHTDCITNVLVSSTGNYRLQMSVVSKSVNILLIVRNSPKTDFNRYSTKELRSSGLISSVQCLIPYRRFETTNRSQR
jgi:hypothetical protein